MSVESNFSFVVAVTTFGRGAGVLVEPPKVPDH